MLNKIGLITLIVSLGMFHILYADKPLERLGNESEFNGDEYYHNKEYIKAAEQYEEAKAKFQEAIEVDGLPIQQKVFDIDEKLWRSYYFGESFEPAIEVLKGMLARNNDEQTAMLIAQIYDRNMNDVAAAISVLESFNEAERRLGVEKRIAKYYYDNNDHENALVWYQKAMGIRQDREIISNIATIYLEMGRQQDAIKAYEDFIKTNPSEAVLVRMYRNLGALHEEIGNMAQAKANFANANNLRFDANVTLKLIDLYYEDNEYNKALSNIDLLIQRSPRNKNHAIYYRAMIRFNRDDFSGARADFSELLNDRTYGNFAKQYIDSIDSM